MRPLIAVLLVTVAAGCFQTGPSGNPVVPALEPNPTPVDQLVLTGELRGVRPGTDMQRVLAAFPELRGMSAGVQQAGLLTGAEGIAIGTERSGGRVQSLWIEFQGSDLVPATRLTSRDGRLRTGATDADVRAYLTAHGLPLIGRVIDLEVEDGEPKGPVIVEYYVDHARSWLVTVDGVLTKALTANRHVYGSGREGAVSLAGE